MLIITLNYAHGSHITKTIISPTQFSHYHSFGLIQMKDKHVSLMLQHYVQHTLHCVTTCTI